MPAENARSGWLFFFLFLLVLALLAVLMSLLTPSWQVVLLEDGRTEHHHGLWIDCKRDFSYDYGRPREYYQTLYRHFDLAGPFDQFWLPSLQCVFKFDYWMDDEDWYEHGYDENQLWGDAYQHLFLGWKIAALAAHVVSALCAIFGVLSLFCAFCHRLCTCISTVLVVIALLSAAGGNVLFYLFASDQDNNIIKEEDGIYEQHFGWSFWVSVLGNLLLLFSSVVGCVATSAVLSRGRRTKFIKIEMDQMDDDSAQLLNRISAGGDSNSSSAIQQPPFRRSKSTVYKIDSKELRRWEREAMQNVRQRQQQMDQFKFERTNSMPNIAGRRQQPQCSTSDISSHAITEPPPQQFIPRREGGIMGGGPPPSSSAAAEYSPSPMDIIYEYVDQQSLSMGRPAAAAAPMATKGGSQLTGKNKSKSPADPWMMANSSRGERQQNQYDAVPLANLATPIDGGGRSCWPMQQRDGGHLIQPTTEETEYLQPRSVSDNSSVSSARTAPLIVPLADAGRMGIAICQQEREFCSPQRSHHFGTPTTFNGPRELFSSFPAQQQNEMMTRLQASETLAPRQFERTRTSAAGRAFAASASSSAHRLPTILSELPPPQHQTMEEQSTPTKTMAAEGGGGGREQRDGTSGFRLNTFQQQGQNGEGDNNNGGSQSRSAAGHLVLLSGRGAPIPSVFDHHRHGTTITSGSASSQREENNNIGGGSTSGGTTSSDRPPTFLGSDNGVSAIQNHNHHQLLLGPRVLPPLSCLGQRNLLSRAPSEMDRSVGSSQSATFLGTPETVVLPVSSSSAAAANPTTTNLFSSTANEDSGSAVTVIHHQHQQSGLPIKEFGSQWTNV